MAAALTECDKEEQQQHVIWLMRSEGVETGGVHGRMTIQYGNSCVSHKKVYA
jgi:hypothetical protein